jgi:hypothetical protein
MSEIFHII